MRHVLALAAGFALAACATTGERQGPAPEQPETPAAPFALEPVEFSALPGWAEADLAPALAALRRTCEARASRTPDAAWSNYGRYGGRMADWAAACTGAQGVAARGERAFFESQFTPYAVTGPGDARLTGYYEPAIEARRAQEAGFTEPVLSRPNDMVSIDIAAFAEAYDNEALRGAPRALTGQLRGAEVRPYPQRAQIVQQPGQTIAWVHPVDLYNLQVQGSGRLVFPDGAPARAAFAAQNGYRWNSALGALARSGELQGATWANFKSWSETRGADATRTALNADPSYVFFTEETIADPSIGPRGAAGIFLQPMGSLAVDPAFHPYGALLFVDGQYNDAPFRRLMVALDTGGAIRRGPLRGDVFFGSGPEAGAAAERMNAPAQFWTLLPRGVPVA
ncbi:MAG: MltA domain-containing protein [Hyphomonadaceae bacterium]